MMVKSWPVELSHCEHAHTNVSLLPSGDLESNVISSVEQFTGPTNNHGAAKSIDYKMVSADKIAQEMSVELFLRPRTPMTVPSPQISTSISKPRLTYTSTYLM